MIFKKWQFWLAVVLIVLTAVIIVRSFRDEAPADPAHMTSGDILKYSLSNNKYRGVDKIDTRV